MKKGSSLQLIFILIVNFLLSYFFNKSNNFLFITVIDLVIWLLLFIPYYFFVGKKRVELISNYCFYFLISLLIMNVLFIIFNINFLKIKVINLFVVGILSFCKFDLNKIKKINIYLILFNVVVFFLLSSSMVPIGNRNSNTDYSVFRYIGLLMHKGKIPYRAVFDHKGLLLYFINYFAIIIHKEIGIWVIEVLFLYLSIIIIYKITKLFVEKMNLFSTIVAFSGLIFTYENAGNFVEQYGLLFILIGIYLFYKDMKFRQEISMKNGFFIGMSLGAIMMLRPNMIAVYVCMALYLLVFYIKDKKIKELFKLIGIFLTGVIVFILPNIIYLIINDAFDEFIYQYLIFNFNYSSANSGNLFETFIFFFKSLKLIYLCIAIIILFLVKRKYDRSYLILSLFMISLSFVLVISPGNKYAHYAMVMIPTFIYPIATFGEYIYNYLSKFILNKNYAKFLIVLFSLLLLFNDVVYLVKCINLNLVSENYFKQIEKQIKLLTNEDDNILVFGNVVNIYLKTNRFTDLKYPYQFPIINIDDKIKEDFKREVINNPPELVLIFNMEHSLFLECFSEILDKYSFYYSSPDYYIYRLRS